MEDARTGPLPTLTSNQRSSSKSHSRRRERHSASNDSVGTEGSPDARSFGVVGNGGGSNRRSKSGLRALQELVSDSRTSNCGSGLGAGEGLMPTRLPQPLLGHKLSMPKNQQQKQQQRALGTKASNDTDDFVKYLGLSDASFGADDSSQRTRRRRPSHSQQTDRLSCAGGDSDNFQSSSRWQQTQPSGQTHSSAVAASGLASDEFIEEESLCQLVGSMLSQADRAIEQKQQQQQHRPNHWDAEAVAAALRQFVGEFGDRIFRFQFRGAFPFNQPEMLEMYNLLAGNFSSIGDYELLLRQCLSDLRKIHLQMQLFLRPDAIIEELDDANLTDLLIAFAEQVDKDLCSASASTNTGHFPNFPKYARRRATVLAAAVGRYAQTAERRRRLVLSRMQSLAATVMSFVARCPSDGVGDGGFRKVVVALFDDMLACFACLGSVNSGAIESGGNSGGGLASRTASPLAASDRGVHSEDEDSFRGFGRNDTPSHLPPPPPSLMQPHDEPPASMDASETDGIDCGDGDVCNRDWNYQEVQGVSGISGGAHGSASSASVEPLEALSLQFMERIEGLLSSFLPNERVNSQEFRASFNSLSEWWRRASVDCTNRLCDRRMGTIREKFDRAQKLRSESNGVKRLYSESETTWDLIEVAKLMVPSEDRTVCVAEAHTAAEWREAVLSLVDAALAPLYLYQLAQDASVLSMRLRADLQRLTNRLTDCGPVPMFCLLRLRLGYYRARQYSDLLRAHPQGCLILELAQVHRVLNRDAYPEGVISTPLNLTVCVPLNDYKKFCQHVKDMHVLSFEARAPVTEKTSLLMKINTLRKIEKCCQCNIDILPPGGSGTASDTATCGATASSPSTAAMALSSAESALASGNRRKPQLIVGGLRPTFGLIVRPDPSHGRANAAMRMICDIVGPANIGERVKYRSFHLSVQLPPNYKPLTVFADTSRPLVC